MKTLIHCQKGALMLAGLFFVLLLTALVYMLVGAAQTISAREGLQDAADAAAFSSAILHARGMNLIAFINLVMAALVAVLVALRLAQGLLIAAAAALYAAAWFGGATLPLAGAATGQAANLQNAYTRAKDVIEPILEGLHTTQEAASVIVPWVAMTDGMLEAARYHKPAKGAFALPPATSLPIESDEFPVLCGKATETATRLALGPIDFIGGPVMEPVYDLAEDLGEATSGFLCGDGKGSPPSSTMKYEEGLPTPPGANSCKKDVGSRECERAQEFRNEATPDPDTGECRVRCAYDEPYETMARRARWDCEERGGIQPKKLTWQRRTVRATFVSDGITWQEQARKELDLEYVDSGPPPCGPSGTYSSEWNRHSGGPEQKEPDPVCARTPSELEEVGPHGVSVTVTFEEVARVFSCAVQRKETRALASEGDSFGGSDSEDKSPHKMQDDVKLGGEAFQIRALSFGSAPGPSARVKRGIVLADEGARFEDDSIRSNIAQLARELGRFSVAQAEFYFDHRGTLPRKEWLWNMHWTARLKHFRLPTGDEAEEEEDRRDKQSTSSRGKVSRFGGLPESLDAQDACELLGGDDCEAAASSLNDFNQFVRH